MQAFKREGLIYEQKEKQFILREKSGFRVIDIQADPGEAFTFYWEKEILLVLRQQKGECLPKP